jgi:prephenate dehydrogenase
MSFTTAASASLSGKIGTALARAFARKNIEFAIANTRGPETLSSLAKELGSSVITQSTQDADKAEMIFLAVPVKRAISTRCAESTCRPTAMVMWKRATKNFARHAIGDYIF